MSRSTSPQPNGSVSPIRPQHPLSPLVMGSGGVAASTTAAGVTAATAAAVAELSAATQSMSPVPSPAAPAASQQAVAAPLQQDIIDAVNDNSRANDSTLQGILTSINQSGGGINELLKAVIASMRQQGSLGTTAIDPTALRFQILHAVQSVQQQLRDGLVQQQLAELSGNSNIASLVGTNHDVYGNTASPVNAQPMAANTGAQMGTNPAQLSSFPLSAVQPPPPQPMSSSSSLGLPTLAAAHEHLGTSATNLSSIGPMAVDTTAAALSMSAVQHPPPMMSSSQLQDPLPLTASSYASGVLPASTSPV